MAVASYFDTVQKLYIAFYQRPADGGGLYFWAQRLDAAAGNQAAVIDAFANSEEAVRLYDKNTDGKITNADASALLDDVFTALFNRAPDAAGKQFYIDALTAGKFPDGRTATVGSVVLDVLNGAQNSDAVAIQNKLEYATAFTKTLDPEQDGIGPFAATYNGDDEAGARTLLAAVTSDPVTRKTAAQVADDIKTQIANPGDAIVGGPDAIKPVVTAQAGIKTYAENQAAGATLETVAATDNVAVTGYKIVTGNESGFFQVSNDGKISLTAAGAVKTVASNDFETTPNDFVLGVQALDAAGNASATSNFSLRVTDLDDRAPVLTGSVVNGTRATLSYDETLSAAKQPAIGDFAVNLAAGGSIAVTSVQVTGNTVVLTLGRAANPGETLNVSYTPGTVVVSDAAGNGVAAVAARPLVADTTAPVITAGQAISYAEDIVTGVPATRTVDTVLGKVAATDDTGVTAYNITAGNEAGFFAVDGAGNIRLTAAGLAGAANNFEVTPNSFVLTVTASDGAGNTSAAQQVTLSVTNVVSDDAAAPPVAQVIQMTTGNDNVSPTGTIGTSRTSDANDTIAAFWDGTAQNTNSGTTIGLGDTFDAAGGTADKLILTLSSGTKLTNAAAPVLNNLEILEVRSTGAAATLLDLSGISPNLTTLNFDASSIGSTVSGVANAVSTFGLTNTNTIVNNTLLAQSASGLAGNADAVTLNLSNNAALQKAGGTGTTLQIAGSVAAAGLGYELVTVNSTGAASAIKALSITDSAGTATATTLTVNGTANLTIDTALDFLGTKGTVNANNFSGNLNIALTAGEDVTVTGGSGNDRFNFANGLTLADKINGGTGNDTIAVSVALNAPGVVIDAINAATSVELVEQTADWNLKADLFTSVKGFVFSGDATANVTNTVNANTFAFSGQNVKGTFTELTPSASDVLNLSFNRAGGATLTGAVGGAGYETVNVALNNTTGVFDGNGNTFTLAAGGTLVVTGAGSVSQAAAGNGITLGVAANINASAATGKLNLNGEGGANNLQGGTNDDLIVGDAGNDTILGNGGNDTITGGADADQLTGGAGNDTFIIGSAAETFTAAPVFAATNTTTANIDRITDFAGNGNLAGDTIQVAAGAFGGAIAGSPASVTAFTVANANNFNDLAGALAGIQASGAALLSVADITVSAGTLAGRYVIINDGTAGYTAGTDAIIGLTGVTGTLNAQDFTVV